MRSKSGCVRRLSTESELTVGGRGRIYDAHFIRRRNVTGCLESRLRCQTPAQERAYSHSLNLIFSATSKQVKSSKERSVKTQRSYMILFATAVTAALSIPAFPQGQNPRESTQTTQTASAKPSGDRPEGVNPPAKVGKDYVIGPDDVLDVSVWKEQELTRSLQVRPDGKISMPLLGDVQAAGLTPGQLAQNVSDKLKKFLTAPQVTVILTQINSQRVYVMGEVTRPGAYPVLPGMTILQA